MSETTLVDAPLFPRLVVRAGGRLIQEAELREELSIGRAEDSDLRLLDPKVSRQHARIRREGRNFVLTDLGSANGTRVDGVLIAGPHVLKHGERISIGNAELTYWEPGRPFRATATMEGVLPGAEEQGPGVGEQLVPPPLPKTGLLKGTSPRGRIRLAAVGVIVALAVVASVVVMLSPQLRRQLLGPALPTNTAAPALGEPTGPAVTETEGQAVQVTATPSSAAAVESVEADELLAQADALVRRSKFEEAVAIYQRLSEEATGDPRPEIGWAWALIFDDQAAAALPHARQAVAREAGSAEAKAVLARTYAALGEIEEALATAEEAVALDPSSAQAHAVLAEAYLLDGQMQEAVDEADLALVQNANNANAHRIRGWLYYLADGDMGRAAGELQVAAGLQPELWLRRHELGLLLLEVGDDLTAILAFQDALAIRPKAVTYTAIGDAYYRQGQYSQARVSLQQALSRGADDVQTYALLATTLAHLNRCDEAETYYSQAFALAADHPLASEAEALCASGQPVATPTTAAPTLGPSPVPTTEAAGQPSGTPPPAARLQGRIAFPSWNTETGRYDVYVADVDGSARRLVTEQMHQPAFSPDGSWLAVNGERPEHLNLFLVRPDGSDLHEITAHNEDGLPEWSPNGKRLAFSSTRHGDKQSRVYIIDDVPFVGGQAEARTLNFGPDDIRGEQPTWTADGRIVYSGCDVTVEPAPCGLFIMSAEPGVHPFQQLTDHKEDTAPAVYGDHVAFMSNREGTWEIYLVNLDGSGLTRLTTNAANDGLPIWSPDGQTIAFVSDQDGGWAVWAMSPDGSNRRWLFAIGNGGLVSDWQHEQISWAP